MKVKTSIANSTTDEPVSIPQKEYTMKLNNFLMALRKAVDPKKIELVWVETGRKFDRVVLYTPNSEVAKTKFFVIKIHNGDFGLGKHFSMGEIYGARSDCLPHTLWYFGTLDTVNLWNWAPDFPEPLSENVYVVARKKYKQFVQYIPTKEMETLMKVKLLKK